MDSRTDASDASTADTATPPRDAGCSLDNAYTYGETGGFVAYVDVTTLMPPTGYGRVRSSGSGAPAGSCTQTIPTCGAGGVSVGDVTRAVGDPDVQAALALAGDTVFGLDSRPVDGSVFLFRRAGDGHGFLVGGDCAGSTGCRPVPPGIAALVTVLRSLDTQELALPGCEALR